MESVFHRNLMEMQSDIQVHKHSQSEVLYVHSVSIKFVVLFLLSYIVLQVARKKPQNIFCPTEICKIESREITWR